MDQYLRISHLGPITETCEITISKWNIFTGPQSSGKSTIAKSVFFFRTIADDILDIALRASGSMNMKEELIKHLSYKFRNLFGYLPNAMELCWGKESDHNHVAFHVNSQRCEVVNHR